MDCLNYEFFDEFKALDNLCRDIYGGSADNKLGVTLYLEDMDKKAYRGSIYVSGWASDYNRLKSARNIRNELVPKNKPCKRITHTAASRLGKQPNKATLRSDLDASCG